MASGIIEGISIKGVSCALPTNKVYSRDRYLDFGKEVVDKIISKTGVESVYKVSEEQTASDLAYCAAKKLIEEKDIDKNDIGVLVFVSQTPDYRMPATAFVLQHRLGLNKECICFDINLGCSGYINGLFSVASIMNSGNIKKALLLVAETPSKRISPLDRSLSMIFGDCGTATFLQKDIYAEPMLFKFISFGGSFKKIIIPAGAYRNIGAPKERVAWPDGNIRSDYDTYMNGQDVFAFSITDVPTFIKEFLDDNNTKESDYDNIILHQANQYILKQITRKLNADTHKTPISMTLYGNTSSASIPLTLAYLKENTKEKRGIKRVLMAGFGIGLSIAVADTYIELENVLPIVHTDDYFCDGAVLHG